MTARRRHIPAALFLAVVAGLLAASPLGCARRPASPPDALAAPDAYFVEVDGDSELSRERAANGAHIPVGYGARIEIVFPKPIDERSFREHLEVPAELLEAAGVRQGRFAHVQLRHSPQLRDMPVRLRAGLRFSSGEIVDRDFKVTLLFREPPHASVELEGLALTAGERRRLYLPARPWTAIVRFTKPMDRRSVEAVIGQEYRDRPPPLFHWEGDRLLRVSFDQTAVGKAYWVYVNGARDRDGVALRNDPGLTFMIVGTSALREVDAASGTARDVSRLEGHRFGRGQVSPTGERVLLFEELTEGGEFFPETAWLFDLPEGRLNQVPVPPGVFSYASTDWLPDGRSFVLNDFMRGATRYAAADGARLGTLLPAPSEGYYVGFSTSPDRRTLAYVKDPGFREGQSLPVFIASLGAGDVREFPSLVRRGPVQPAAGVDLQWSPDGRLLAFTEWGDPDGTVDTVGGLDVPWRVSVLDIATGSKRVLVERASSPRWSPAGDRLLVFSLAAGKYQLVGLAGAVMKTLEGEDVTFPRWAPDGRRILFKQHGPGGEVRAVLHDLETGAWRDLGQGVPLGWSPDGKKAYVLAEGSTPGPPE